MEAYSLYATTSSEDGGGTLNKAVLETIDFVVVGRALMGDVEKAIVVPTSNAVKDSVEREKTAMEDVAVLVVSWL